MVGEIIWIPVNEVIQPKNNYRVYVDYYWIVKDDKVAIYQNGFSLIAQANVKESVMNELIQHYPGAHVEFLHLAYLPSWAERN